MKEIKLSQAIKRKNYALNLVALVDDEDYDYLNQWTWCADFHRKTCYVHRCIVVNRKRIKIRMHRLIMGVTDSKILIDHIDGNGLNNCKINLRTCNALGNAQNRGKDRRKTSSIYKGVHLHKATNKWSAEVRAKGVKRKYLGLFDSEVDAAIAYNNAAKIHHGEFARLNLIQ